MKQDKYRVHISWPEPTTDAHVVPETVAGLIAHANRAPTPVHDAERERLQNKRWIMTFSGRRFWPLDPRAADVRIEDIAHALAQQNRYTGHARVPYSVAQHSYRASHLVSSGFQLAALLHDAAEAYLPDLAAPIKRSFYAEMKPAVIGFDEEIEQFAEVESRVLDAIFEGLGLSSLRQVAESEEVKKADLQMLAWEARDLLIWSAEEGAPTLEDWHLTETAPYASTLVPMDWHEAERVFLQRYRELTGVPR